MGSVPEKFNMSQETFENLVSVVGHDAFRSHGGLGTSGRMIYMTLMHRGMLSAKALVEHTGLSSDTVRRHLNSLEAEGLVSRINDEWSTTDVTPSDVHGLRSEGRADRQSDQYARERRSRDAGQSLRRR